MTLDLEIFAAGSLPFSVIFICVWTLDLVWLFCLFLRVFLGPGYLDPRKSRKPIPSRTGGAWDGNETTAGDAMHARFEFVLGWVGFVLFWSQHTHRHAWVSLRSLLSIDYYTIIV